MPCRDYESDWGRSNYSNAEFEALKVQNDRLARVACEAMTRLTELADRTKRTYTLTQETYEWWAKHQEADRAEQLRISKEKEKVRRAEEAAKRRADAIKSLSKEQRNALGL